MEKTIERLLDVRNELDGLRAKKLDDWVSTGRWEAGDVPLHAYQGPELQGG